MWPEDGQRETGSKGTVTRIRDGGGARAPEREEGVRKGGDRDCAQGEVAGRVAAVGARVQSRSRGREREEDYLVGKQPGLAQSSPDFQRFLRYVEFKLISLSLSSAWEL